MATGRMNQLLVMVNLCSSVVEGIEHLMAFKENDRLKEDTVTGLLTLEESLKGFMADKSVIHETKWMAQVIKTRLFVYDQEFKNRLYRWYFSALKELRNLMTAEVERCPVCSGKGETHYGAVLYMEDEDADQYVLEPVRVFMKCRDCGNYYLAREESRLVNRKKGTNRTKVRCERLLADIGEFAAGGTMLFIGEERSPLYKEARKAGYHPQAMSLEEAGGQIEGDKKAYRIVLIDRISRTQDLKLILTQAAEYLAEDGILWFDGPDLDKSIKNLEKKGASMWKGEVAEVCMTDRGIDALAEKCGLSIRSYRHVGTASGRIEVIAQKKE
ncbi:MULTISPECIES: hypothetical protein [Lacrimispora]|uniref:Uncharacterized protein n=1 Tax=Lacrimispora celerecrescens TaxID=29354 RepID=A0A084JLQ0_9FIRM|nr:hypothetical protein [Lacrimispora celerecrescens]KEZ89884.1 hypothetical protein IO98_12175 [Lacrimispora celerecrescens]MBW4845224.1 hypothetical protein [Lachnospiraceae bacterium]